MKPVFFPAAEVIFCDRSKFHYFLQRRLMTDDGIRHSHVLGFAIIAMVVLYLYDAVEAWQLMTPHDLLAWVVVGPCLSAIPPFAFALFRPLQWYERVNPNLIWPKALAYGLILIPVALLLFVAVVGTLLGSLDHVRWIFGAVGVMVGLSSAKLIRPTLRSQ